MKKNHSYLYRNSLCIAFLLLMLLSFAGQIYTGWKEHNDFLADYGKSPLSIGAYLFSGHFLQATFENWESEFFQMAVFVIFTIFLRQSGSSESKECDEALYDPEDLVPKPDSPLAVKGGGYFPEHLQALFITGFIFSFYIFLLYALVWKLA